MIPVFPRRCIPHYWAVFGRPRFRMVEGQHEVFGDYSFPETASGIVVRCILGSRTGKRLVPRLSFRDYMEAHA